MDDGNITCQSQYFNLDRLSLVQRSYGAAVNLWTSGYCDNCFEAPLTISNQTILFNTLIDDFSQCIFVEQEICKNCADSYNKANKYYDELKAQANEKVCFDLQDLINGTRRFWSDIKCNTNPSEKQITFLILSAAVTALPICFYVLMFAHTHHKEQMNANREFLSDGSVSEPLEDTGSSDNLVRGADYSNTLAAGGSTHSH